MIDIINPFDYPEADRILANTRRALPAMKRLVEAFRAQGRPVIYANDNFGQWRSNFPDIVRRCREGNGRDVVEAMHPASDDYFVLKPHRSAFYDTPLERLLNELGAEHLLLAGIATDMCVLASASDAHMRSYHLTIVSDATAAVDEARHDSCLDLMGHTLDAKVASTQQVLMNLALERK